MSQANTMNGKTWDEIKMEPMNWIQMNIDGCFPEDSLHVKAQSEIPYALIDVMDEPAPPEAFLCIFSGMKTRKFHVQTQLTICEYFHQHIGKKIEYETTGGAMYTLTIERYNAESQKKATEDYGNKKMFIDTKGFNITAAQATDTFRIHMAELGISLKGEVWEVTDATTRTRTGSWGAGFEYMSLFAIDLIIRKNVMIRIDGNPAKLTFHKAFADSQKFCNSCNKYTAHPPPIAYGIPPQHHPHHHESEKCDCHLNKGKRPAETKASKVTAFQMRRAKAKKTTLA